MDIELLYTFEEVARSGSLTRAAEELGISQSTASRRIAALEEELGATLFEPLGRGVRLSEQGERLLLRAHELSALVSDIRADVVSEEDRAVTLTVGALPTIVSHLLAPAMGELFERYPRLNFDFRLGNMDALANELRTGRVDVVIGVGEHSAFESFAQKRLGHVHLSLVVHPSSRVSCLREARQERLLLWEGMADPTFEYVQKLCAREMLGQQGMVRIPSIESLRAMVAENIGVSILPTYTGRADERLGRVRLHRLPAHANAMPVTLAWRRSQRISGRLRDFVDYAQEKLPTLLA